MDQDEPRDGYGAGDRPLWSTRDRDIERIRQLLRAGGHREFDLDGERQPGGFAVEGVNSSEDGDEPFLVSCAEEYLAAAGELRRYAILPRGAGWRVRTDRQDEGFLEVRLGA